MSEPLKLNVLGVSLSICRLGPADPVPHWAWTGPFACVVRTGEELSVVCAATSVPEGVKVEPGWRALAVEGPLDVSLTGIMAGLTDPLAKASIPIFALSTFDTDYLLVPERHLRRAVDVLRASGYEVRANGHG